MGQWLEAEAVPGEPDSLAGLQERQGEAGPAELTVPAA
jgi:hypothetical protein